MIELEKMIREHALARIAKIFRVSIDGLRSDMKLGEDLVASFVSDFKYNELDQLLHDIRDVADKKIIKEINDGVIAIYTVEDYCNHMVQCYKTRPEEVSRILHLQPA